ncbi:hypothetical protein [Vibrio sp. A1-1]|uniref:hypothetical protein n=1 Tax=Vibrio sp. A1-1 TaxID=2912250 RepID=UPI001F340217|nr:hypothetical protein [Vibrio sp. A1-1]EHU0358685.1 hypothetical protein [Vibrio parahaemolyticus]MCF7455909.1 hypothetical protein [Vibrio sp. A1-1]
MKTYENVNITYEIIEEQVSFGGRPFFEVVIENLKTNNAWKFQLDVDGDIDGDCWYWMNGDENPLLEDEEEKEFLYVQGIAIEYIRDLIKNEDTKIKIENLLELQGENS